MTEQIPLSCHSCKQVFNEVMEEARKYSKSNPFICHLCMKQRENPSQKIVDHDLSPHSRQNDSQTFNDVDVIATAQREAESKDHHDNKIHFHIGVPHLHHETPTE